MVASTFDPENPKFKCFFGMLHVASTAKQVFWYHIIFNLLRAVISISSKFSWPLFYGHLIVILSDALIFGTGIYAIQNEKPNWLLPFLAVFILLTINDAYVIGFHLINQYYKNEWMLYKIANFAACVYFIVIVHRCYQYLKAKKQSEILPMFFSNKNIQTDLY